MAEDLGSAVLTLRTDNQQFDSGMANAERRAQAFGQKATAGGRALTMGLTVPILGVGAAALKMGVDFNDSLDLIAGLVGVSREQINAWKDDIYELSGATAQSPKILADALYFITSSGLSGQQALDALKASAYAASAGLGSAAVVADAVTTAMNAYASSNLTADHAAGILTATVREGKGEADAIAGAIGRVIQVSAQLGISFDEVGAAMAGMTLTGLEAEEAATALRGIMLALMSPTVEASAALTEAGLSAEGLRQQAGSEGLLSVLQTLKGAFGENVEAMTAVFGNVRALVGQYALVGENAAITEQIFKELAATTGQDLYTAFDAVAEGPGFRMKQAMNDISVELTKLGDALAPIVADMLEAGSKLTAMLSSLVEGFEDLPPSWQKAIVVALLLVATLGPLLLVIGAIISIAPMMGAAAAIAFGPWGVLVAGLAVTIGGLAVSMKLANTDMKDLGLTAAQTSERMGDFAESILAPIARLEDKFAPGLNLVGQRLENVQRRSDQLNNHIALLKLGIDPMTASLGFSATALARLAEGQDTLDKEFAAGNITIANYQGRQLALIATLKEDITAHMALRDSVLNVRATVVELAASGAMIEPFRQAIAAALSASDVIAGVRQGLIALMATQGVLAAQMAAFRVGTVLPDLDIDSVESRMQEIADELAASAPAVVDAGSYVGAEMGEAMGEAIAESLVPAFVQEMQRQESIADIIAQAISARDVNWSDVARLYELGAIDVAQDFTRALQGELSNIGAQIWATALTEGLEAARIAAWQAGIEAAQAYTDAFAQGIGDLQGAISDFFGSIGSLTSTQTVEDAQLELEILLAQRDALYDIAKLEEQRAVYVQRIAEIEADAAWLITNIEQRTAAWVGELQTAIDANEQLLDTLNAHIATQRAAQQAIRNAADAQIDAVQVNIDANEDLIDALEKQLKLKQETLRADQETLSIYKETFAEHEKLLAGFERQLETLQDERESAWKILGMAAGGGDLPPSLTSAATELKRLQDEMAKLLAGGGAWNINDLGNWNEAGTAATPEFTALQESIDEARRQFEELDAQAQAEIASTQDKIAAQATLLEQDQALIDSIQEKITADEAAIDATKALIDATREMIQADKDMIDNIQARADRWIAIIQEDIDATNERIDATEALIAADKEQIKAIEDAAAAQIKSIEEITATQVKAIQDQIDAVDASIKKIDDHIASLQAEERAREANRKIMQLQLQLESKLLLTDEELVAQIKAQIYAGELLQGVYENLTGGIYDVNDAALAAYFGLRGLADLINALVANPALGALLPTFSSGGIVPGNIGQPVLAVVHGGERISSSGEAVTITMNNTYNGTQNIPEVEKAQQRVMNKSLRAAGLIV